LGEGVPGSFFAMCTWLGVFAMPFMRGVRGWGAPAGCREALGLVIGCVDRGRALVRCDVEELRGRGDSAGVDMVVRAPARQVAVVQCSAGLGRGSAN
jgi:hypothetical protein